MELFFFLKPNSFSHSQVCELETSLDGIILSIYLSLSLSFQIDLQKRLHKPYMLFLIPFRGVGGRGMVARLGQG